MLEHLDAHNPVETAGQLLGAEVELGDIAGVDGQIVQAPFAGAVLDELALAVGIGKADDPAVGVALRQPGGERPPAATEVENPHAVLQLRALGVKLQHLLLGLGQGLPPGRIQAAGVLELRPEVGMEELRRHFIVLLIGGLGLDGDRCRAQLIQKAIEAPRTFLAIEVGLVD